MNLVFLLVTKRDIIRSEKKGTEAKKGELKH